MPDCLPCQGCFFREYQKHFRLCIRSSFPTLGNHPRLNPLILLPGDLFCNTPAAGIISTLNRNKMPARKGKIVLVNASKKFKNAEYMKNESKSEWQTRELAQTFLKDVRGAIPGADLQLAVIGKIARQWCRNPACILDVGCGNGILGQFLLNLFPSANGLFVDFSDPMLDAALSNVGGNSRATVAKADFSSPQWLESVKSCAPFDLVVSGFAIHHQPDNRKRILYSEIFDLLAPGGVFLNLEHVASATEAGQALFDDFFVDHLHEFHLRSDLRANRESVADAYYRRSDKKENILAPVEDQCRWLREIGFADVDCFFKVFELALFGGRKISAR